MNIITSQVTFISLWIGIFYPFPHVHYYNYSEIKYFRFFEVTELKKKQSLMCLQLVLHLFMPPQVSLFLPKKKKKSVTPPISPEYFSLILPSFSVCMCANWSMDPSHNTSGSGKNLKGILLFGSWFLRPSFICNFVLILSPTQHYRFELQKRRSIK